LTCGRRIKCEQIEEKNGTKTSPFGSPRRINHDRLYEGVPKEERVEDFENPIPSKFIDKIFCKSSEKMDELPDCSVHLMVTSPHYNVGKEVILEERAR